MVLLNLPNVGKLLFQKYPKVTGFIHFKYNARMADGTTGRWASLAEPRWDGGPDGHPTGHHSPPYKTIGSSTSIINELTAAVKTKYPWVFLSPPPMNQFTNYNFTEAQRDRVLLLSLPQEMYTPEVFSEKVVNGHSKVVVRV